MNDVQGMVVWKQAGTAETNVKGRGGEFLTKVEEESE